MNKALDLAKELYNPMFGNRDSINEAYEYMQKVAMATDNPAAVITACQVVVNTIAIQMELIANQLTGEDIQRKTELEQIVEGWVNA